MGVENRREAQAPQRLEEFLLGQFEVRHGHPWARSGGEQAWSRVSWEERAAIAGAMSRAANPEQPARWPAQFESCRKAEMQKRWPLLAAVTSDDPVGYAGWWKRWFPEDVVEYVIFEEFSLRLTNRSFFLRCQSGSRDKLVRRLLQWRTNDDREKQEKEESVDPASFHLHGTDVGLIYTAPGNVEAEATAAVRAAEAEEVIRNPRRYGMAWDRMEIVLGNNPRRAILQEAILWATTRFVILDNQITSPEKLQNDFKWLVEEGLERNSEWFRDPLLLPNTRHQRVSRARPWVHMGALGALAITSADPADDPLCRAVAATLSAARVEIARALFKWQPARTYHRSQILWNRAG